MKKKFRGITVPIIFLVIIITIIVVISIKNKDENNEYKIHYNRINELYSTIDSKTINFEKKLFESIDEEAQSLRLAEYYDALTRYYILNNDLKASKNYSDKAMNEYRKIKNKDNYILNTFKNICIIDIWDFNSIKSLKYNNVMLEVVKKDEIIKDSNFTKEDIEGLSYAMITLSYCKSNNQNKAKEYFNFLSSVNEKNIKDREIRYIVDFAKSIYELSWINTKMAEEDMKRLSEEMDAETRDLRYIKPTIYLNTSIIQILNGDLQNALLEINKAAKLNNNTKNNILIQCYISYGMYYDMQGNFEKAKENYEKSLSLSRELNENIEAIQSIGFLISLCEKYNKNVENGLYYKMFWQLSNFEENDSSNYITNIIALNDQLNNERVSTIENEKKSEVEKRKLMRIALVIVLIALVILSLGTKKLYNEIKLRKKSEKKLKATINQDYLTKAYTRGYAYETLKSMIEAKNLVYLAMVDLDDYKKINDAFGHVIGDRVLVEFVQICNYFLQENDFVARFGGEEFIIILNDKSKEEAIKIVESIRQMLEKKDWDIDNLMVTASIGLAYNTDENIDMLIKKADDLLYLAKEMGKNRIKYE